MPPVLAAFIGSILRHALTGLAVYFVSHGYFVQSDADNYIAAFIAATLGLAWSYYQKHQAKLRELVGLGLPAGSTSATIDAKMEIGATPPMTITGTPMAIFLALALAGVMTMPACHKTIPSTIVTPQGKVAYQVEDALDAIGALQHAAIDARRNNLIKTPVMRSIVKGTMAATRTLQVAVENGTGARAAYADVSVALMQVQQALPSAEAQKLAPYFASVQSILAALTPQQEEDDDDWQVFDTGTRLLLDGAAAITEEDSDGIR